MDTDTRIEAFPQTVERLTLIPGQLQTLAITLARADELPGIMARCSCRLDAARLREEQTAIGYEVLTGKSPLDDQDRPALVAEARTAIEFTFPSALGKTYRIEASIDLSTWTTVESDIAGIGGQIQRFYSTRNLPKRYFRVEEDTP